MTYNDLLSGPRTTGTETLKMNEATTPETGTALAGRDSSELLERLEALGKKGFTVSIAYGPCGHRGLMYSVDILAPDGRSFDKPYAAQSFEQAIFIAENEISERGWAAH